MERDGRGAFAVLALGALMVLGVTGSRYRNLRTGATFFGRHAIFPLIHARRSIADMLCRTETLRLPKGWGKS